MAAESEPGLDALERGVGVVVVNYASADLIEENLGPLARSSPGLEILVVDAAHSVEARRAVAALCSEYGWSLLGLDDNPGFGAAMNAGVSAATASGADTALLLNPDLSIDVSAVRELVEASRGDPRSIVTPRIDRPDGRVWSAGSMIDRRAGRPGPIVDGADAIFWVSGACMAVSTSFYAELGGFDEEYFMYWEDVDLSHRCAAAGGRLIVVDSAVAVHEVGATQGDGKSPLYIRSNCRNRMLFAAKHLSRREVARWLLATPRSSWLIARRGTRRTVLLRSPALLWAMTVGTTESVIAGIRRLVARRG